MLWSSYKRCRKTMKEILGYLDSQAFVSTQPGAELWLGRRGLCRGAHLYLLWLMVDPLCPKFRNTWTWCWGNYSFLYKKCAVCTLSDLLTRSLGCQPSLQAVSFFLPWRCSAEALQSTGVSRGPCRVPASHMAPCYCPFCTPDRKGKRKQVKRVSQWSYWELFLCQGERVEGLCRKKDGLGLYRQGATEVDSSKRILKINN